MVHNFRAAEFLTRNKGTCDIRQQKGRKLSLFIVHPDSLTRGTMGSPMNPSWGISPNTSL